MSSNVLSNELFFEAHRGLHKVLPKDVDQSHLGMHWSADPDVGRGFANSAWGPGMHTTGNPGVIYHAQIPVSSVETDTHNLHNKKVGGEFEFEQEVPVKEKAKVFVTGRTKVTPSSPPGEYQYDAPRIRRRSYNPPREMTA